MCFQCKVIASKFIIVDEIKLSFVNDFLSSENFYSRHAKIEIQVENG